MKNKRGRRRLAALLSGILALSCALSSVPVGALEGEDPLSADDGKVNYALGSSYTSTTPYSENGTILYPDTGNMELTDGKMAVDSTEHTDPEWVGFAGSPQIAEVTIDLGLERTFDTVEYVNYVYGGAAIGVPATEEVEFSSDGIDWTTFYSGEGRTTSVEQGTDVMTIPGEVATARFVRFRFTYVDGTWLFFSEFRVLGDAGANACEIPQFTKNLSASQSAYVGDMINFQVEAQVSDGGTLSYQWYKDDQPIGENSNSYNIARATLEDAGEYRVEVTNTNGDATAVAASRRCVLKVTDGGGDPEDPDEPVLNPDPNNLAEGAAYTSSWRASPDYPDEGTKMLTDTVVASEASFRDQAWVGYNSGDAPDENPLAIIVDLGDTKKFMEVAVNFLSNPTSGIYCPTGMKVSISEDQSEWTALSDDAISRPSGNTIYQYQYVADTMKSARYVKLEITSDSAWTFLDEIKVLEYPQSSMPGDQSDNLAYEKSYTSNPAASSDYPDGDLTKLTDGRTGVLDFSNGLWVGYAGNGSTSEVVVDLGSSMAFEQIEMNFLNDAGTGIYYPESVQVQISGDGSEWSDLFTDTVAAATGDLSIYHLQHALDAAATARYVKVIFPTTHWVFIDEIRVLKDRTIIPEAPVEEEEMDPNNISYGKDYTLAFNANTSYPDIGNKQLTDGKRATSNYAAREWVGFHIEDKNTAGADCFSMVIDLGETQSFEQVKVGFLNSSTVGIYAPDGQVKIETSNDQSSWTLFAQTGDNYFDRDGTGVRRYIAEGSASARYVKVSVYYSDYWMFMDEIEILAVKDEREDADVNPDNGWENNLVRDYSYTLSRNPSQNAGIASSALTDGKYAVTGTKYDTNWIGFGSGNRVTIGFDLQAPASVSKIVFGGRESADDNQILPQNMTISVSIDGETWGTLKTFGAETGPDLVWDGSVDSFNSALASAKAVYARYINIEFDVPQGDDVVFVDEIEIIGKLGRCSYAGPIAADKNPDGSYNLALGKTYYLDEVEVPNDHPDVGGIQLTDGITGTDSPDDSAWVGYQRYVHISGDYGKAWPLKEITVDLGEPKSIISTKINILGQGASSMYTQPWTIRVFASMDGENWMPMYKNWDLGLGATGIHSYGWRFEDTQGTPEDLTPVPDAPYIARYVRYDIELYNMQLVDEIEVYGYDGIVEGAQELTNFTTLENGPNWNRAGEHNDYTHDALLVYTSWSGADESGQIIGDWKPDWFRPYLTYINRQGEAVDTMFDTFYFLALWSRYGANFHDTSASAIPSVKKDWEWFIDKTFADGGDMDALESAAETAAMELNDPDFYAKAILMVPIANYRVSDFGEINGENVNLSTPDGREKVLNWYMQEVLDRFEEKNYQRIKFIGFCFVGEHGDDGDQRQVMSDFCEANDLHSFWIPYSASYGQLYYDKWGIENMSLQPNHYFGNYWDTTGNGKTTNYHLTTSSIEKHARMAAYCGGSVEMECGDGIIRNEPGKYNQFLDYLNGTSKLGLQGPEYCKFWYQDTLSIYRYCFSTNNNVRNLYEYIYQYIHGTYTEKPYIDNVDYNPDGDNLVRPAYYSAEGYVPAAGTGQIGGNGASGNEEFTGGGSTGGSGGGGGYYPNDPDEPDEPSTPEEPTAPSGDDNYTWEEVDGDYQLTDANGEVVTGWAQVAGKWYYLNDNGFRTVGWLQVDGTWYYLNADGTRATGWLKLKNTWYYLNADGEMQTGWLKDGGAWYYLYNWGGMANTSWVKVGNTWYYFRGNGHMMTGWLQLGSTWYYLKSSGAMATGWQKVGNTWYYLKSNGAMAKGWLKLGNTWYYLKSSGAMSTGWNWVGNKCYYFDGSGKMAANTTVGGYKVDASGAWVQ